jgi:trk system potassium uptake protein TrkA
LKRFIVIGLGNFGSTVAARLHELGNEVIAIDGRAEAVDAMSSRASHVFMGDATKRAVLEEAGARHADVAVISTGDNLAASTLALVALRDLGVREIYVKVTSDEQARIADALGAEESVFPERESGLGLASRITTGALLKYISLGSELSLQEMAVPETWHGKTLRELGLPKNYSVQVVAVHDVLRDKMIPIPPPDRPLTDSDTLLVAGHPAVLERLANLCSR